MAVNDDNPVMVVRPDTFPSVSQTRLETAVIVEASLAILVRLALNEDCTVAIAAVAYTFVRAAAVNDDEAGTVVPMNALIRRPDEKVLVAATGVAAA